MGNVIKNVVDEFEIMIDSHEAIINNYVVFLSCLSMAVMGLGYVVLTWTTVVLLGGFVSMLEKKDLWSLTVITLVQIAGVFDDVSLQEKLNNIGYSFLGLVVSMVLQPAYETSTSMLKRLLLRAGLLVAAIVQALVFVLALFPVAAAYVGGLYISTGVSLWRLIQRDYGDESHEDPSKKNLRPALNVLYSLALLQGVLFCYRAIFGARRGKALVHYVVREYNLDDKDGEAQAREFVADYLSATKIGCSKDLSFARGRKLLTHIVDRMESGSSDGYLSGARMLELLLQAGGVQLPSASPDKERLLRVLLLTLDPVNPYGEEARERTARIVENLADEFNLEKIPTAAGLRCIASLLEEPGHKLALWGVRILWKLGAAAHNIRAMRNYQGLATKIEEVIDFHPGLMHQVHDDALSDVRPPPLRATLWLMETVRGGGTMLLTMLERVLCCDKCGDSKQQEAMNVLYDIIISEAWDVDEVNHLATQLSVNILARASKEYVTKLARDKWEKLIAETDYLSMRFRIIPGVKDVLVDATENESECRTAAAVILERVFTVRGSEVSSEYGFCRDFIEDDMPKLLREILQLEEKLGAETDIEAGRVSQDSYPPGVQQVDTKLLGAILSLCAVAREAFINAGNKYQDRLDKLDEVAGQICLDAGKPAKNVAALLKEAQELLDEKKNH